MLNTCYLNNTSKYSEQTHNFDNYQTDNTKYINKTKTKNFFSGTYGENLSYLIESNTLLIYGTGDMYSFSEESPEPWNDGFCTFNYVNITDGVISIGSLAFFNSHVFNTYQLLIVLI